MADVCGPWTLEQLDQFGTLDSLPFSLDSDIWLTACIRDGDGAVSAVGSVTATPNRELVGAGAISATGSVTSTGVRERFGEASMTASGTMASGGARVRQIDQLQRIFAYGDLYGYPGIEYNFTAEITGTCDVTAFPARTLEFSGNINGSCNVTAVPYKYGEEWSDVPDESNTWTPVSDGSNVWTEITSGNNSWQLRG